MLALSYLPLLLVFILSFVGRSSYFACHMGACRKILYAFDVALICLLQSRLTGVLEAHKGPMYADTRRKTPLGWQTYTVTLGPGINHTTP